MDERQRWAGWKEAWRVLLGSGVVIYGVVVISREAPGSLPYVLVTGMGLIGLSISVPWERKRDDEKADRP